MSWHGIQGHDVVVEQFRRALGRRRLASSFLFTGPEGIGKRTFATKFAQSLLCQERSAAALDPCGHCPSCAQVAASTHPDLLLVAKPEGKSEIPVALLIGDLEDRMREGLCHDIGLKPFMGGRRVAIIDDADYLNEEGANSLLKTLEEPPPHSVLILIGTSPAKQLPTIRSRCQLVRFQPLTVDMVADVLVSRGLASDLNEAKRLASHSGGCVRRALELSDPEVWDFRETLLKGLAEPLLDSVSLSASLVAFTEKAGKEAPARRARLRQVVLIAAEFYQRLLRNRSFVGENEEHITPPLKQALTQWPGDCRAAEFCLERCLDAAEQIDRNVHQTLFIECWLTDLAKATQWPSGKLSHPHRTG